MSPDVWWSLAAADAVELPQSDWLRAVWAVLWTPAGKQRSPDWLASTFLDDPLQVAEAQLETLADELQRGGTSGKRAATLRGLAQWWCAAETDAPCRDLPLDAAREKLRKLPGASWVLADRILLWAGQRDVWPLERAIQRILVRHGWIDSAADYEEWQSALLRHRGEWHELVQASAELYRIGQKHCGRIPDCAQCALRDCLPPSGPVDLAEGTD